ncbi:uncharacterized protein LOC142606354 [Castanea sativa]|uniref:uncharacterized protein LOC142606354 n=1 Tax=Castanea sativa TaxID=21020 RepID=UPI003F64DC52
MGSGTQGNTSSRPPLGTVNVIFATPGRADSCPSRVMTVVRPLFKNSNHGLKKAKIALQLPLSFLEKDKFGNIQPHDDALVVTLRIGIKKKNGKWRVCVDFSDLNKACPKDPFPMPRIDQLVDATVGHLRMSFLDVFQGSHQIPLALDDQEKTTFVTPTRNYHYKPSHNPKEVQRLTGMMAALNQFISRSTDRCRPFFQLLNKWKEFEWTEECAFAFQQLKGLVLLRVDNSVQRPVYYVSNSLHKAEICYLPLEKAILVVVHATRKLLHYFQSHTVMVLTQLPLRSLLRSADIKWGTILGAFDINYIPLTSVKSLVLADLVAEFTELSLEEHMKRSDMDKKSVGMIALKESLSWKVYVDGTANQRGSGVGLVIIFPEKIVIEKSLRMGFSAIYNEVEYEALLIGMNMVQKMGGKNVEMFLSSRLTVGQVEQELEARDSRMQEYLSQGLDIVGPFPKAVANKKFLLVDTDYFTKWVEAKLLSNIKDLDARRFVWKNIVTQFEIPHTRISDNGVQFDSKNFKRYCCDLGITNKYSTPAYPQGNG